MFDGLGARSPPDDTTTVLTVIECGDADIVLFVDSRHCAMVNVLCWRHESNQKAGVAFE